MRNSVIDFTEFTSLLIKETLDAIIESMLEQEKKIIEMEKEAYWDIEHFSEKYIHNRDVRKALQNLFFKHSEKGDITTVDPGQPYIPEWECRKEKPDIFSKIGYKMNKDEDYHEEECKCGYVITKLGYQRIYNIVRLILAEEYQSLIKSLIAKGIPRVHMDHGRISSKIMLSFANEGSQRSNDRRLLVSTINATSPEFLTLKSNISSEIEINFKTIVP